MKPQLRVLLPVVLVAALAQADHPAEAPDATIDGLQRISSSRLDLVYALPGADLGRYKRVFLLQPDISFVHDYLHKQNHANPQHPITRQDMERMRKSLATILVEEFTAELQHKAGYVVVYGVAEDVLAVRPAVLDLDVLAPETGSSQRSAIPSVGQMTLYMELIDSVSGDVLVKALDHQVDRTRARLNVRDQDRNEQAARDIVRQWAGVLRQGLDEARLRADQKVNPQASGEG